MVSLSVSEVMNATNDAHSLSSTCCVSFSQPKGREEDDDDDDDVEVSDVDEDDGNDSD
jgi:hypothetical protein